MVCFLFRVPSVGPYMILFVMALLSLVLFISVLADNPIAPWRTARDPQTDGTHRRIDDRRFPFVSQSLPGSE